MVQIELLEKVLANKLNELKEQFKSIGLIPPVEFQELTKGDLALVQESKATILIRNLKMYQITSQEYYQIRFIKTH
jgi:hypothetical protein